MIKSNILVHNSQKTKVYSLCKYLSAQEGQLPGCRPFSAGRRATGQSRGSECDDRISHFPRLRTSILLLQLCGLVVVYSVSLVSSFVFYLNLA